MKTLKLNGFEPLSQEGSVAVTGGAIVLSQTLSWDTVLADLVGSAVAQGEFNAQANVDLGQASIEGSITLT